jgi:Uma2 family endonuclease
MMSVLITSTPIIPAPLTLGAAGKSMPPVVAQIAALRPYRLSVEQFEAMIKAGIVGKYDRCELIRGELIEKMTIGDSHVAAVRRLIRFFKRVNDDEALIGAQDALQLQDSRPEPDFLLLVPQDDCYESRTAESRDVLLLIEVADVSLTYDRKVKLPLYAENGIQEYWIVNLIDDCIEVFRQPQGLEYADRRVVGRGQSIAPLALPQMSLAAESILGPTQQATGG